jgi:hypothetical protein
MKDAETYTDSSNIKQEHLGQLSVRHAGFHVAESGIVERVSQNRQDETNERNPMTGNTFGRICTGMSGLLVRDPKPRQRSITIFRPLGTKIRSSSVEGGKAL